MLLVVILIGLGGLSLLLGLALCRLVAMSAERAARHVEDMQWRRSDHGVGGTAGPNVAT